MRFCAMLLTFFAAAFCAAVCLICWHNGDINLAATNLGFFVINAGLGIHNAIMLGKEV